MEPLFEQLGQKPPKMTQTQTTSYSVLRERVDSVVIGAGVVGIAVARGLALKGREVIVIESASSFGTELVQGTRNSEVVHAGIYYPQHSLKVGAFLVVNVFVFM
jgi:2-hydroxyglutarate dehydrogenase